TSPPERGRNLTREPAVTLEPLISNCSTGCLSSSNCHSHSFIAGRSLLYGVHAIRRAVSGVALAEASRCDPEFAVHDPRRCALRVSLRPSGSLSAGKEFRQSQWHRKDRPRFRKRPQGSRKE